MIDDGMASASWAQIFMSKFYWHPTLTYLSNIIHDYTVPHILRWSDKLLLSVPCESLHHKCSFSMELTII